MSSCVSQYPSLLYLRTRNTLNHRCILLLNQVQSIMIRNLRQLVFPICAVDYSGARTERVTGPLPGEQSGFRGGQREGLEDAPEAGTPS